MSISHVVVNPTTRSASVGIRAVRAMAERLGMREPRIVATSPREHGRQQTEVLLASGARRFVAIGGDGTVREVASALAGTDATLGIIPSGTANLFARNLELPLRSTARAAKIALTGLAQPTDLGRVKLLQQHRDEPERVFLVVTGIGHDAEAVQSADIARKRRLGWLAYIDQGVRRFSASAIPLRARFDGGELERSDAWSLLVHNSAKIPVGFEVLPGTRLDDGWLHVAVVSPKRLSHWGRIALSGMGFARAEGILRYRTTKRIRVEAEAQQTVQIDGDPFGQTNGFEAWIDPGSLLVRTSISAARRA